MRRPAARALLPLAAGLVVGAGTLGVLAALDGDDEPLQPTADATAAEHQRGRTMFARMGCGSCHRLAAAGSTGTIGPNLDARLPGYTAATLAQRIVRRAQRGSFTTMPDDFGDRMTDSELDALVRFLLSSVTGPAP